MAAITSTQNTFRIGHPDPTIDCPILQREALKKAVARLKSDYPEVFEVVFAKHLYSEEERLEFITNFLKKGSCAGTSDVLFDQIVQKNSSSLADSVPLLNSEDIFYHQILQYLSISIGGKKTDSAEMVNFKDIRYMLKRTEEHNTLYESIERHLPKGRMGPPSSGEECILKILTRLSEQHMRLQGEYFNRSDKREKEFEAQCDRQKAHIQKNLHYKTFLDSEKFSVAATRDVYRKTLDNAMHVFSQNEDFVALLLFSNHGIGFQYGPRGYFLFDPIHPSKGLFAYPHRGRFFEGLMHHAQEDAFLCSGKKGKKKRAITLLESLNEDIINKVTRIQTHFLIRPLSAINPTHREPLKKIRDKQEALRALVRKEEEKEALRTLVRKEGI